MLKHDGSDNPAHIPTVILRIVNIRQQLVKDECYRLLPLLSEHDRERASRYLHEEDRLRFLAGRLLIRSFADNMCQKGELCFSEYGKPFFTAENDYQFNLSHSGDYVAIAYGKMPVGIDIEQIKPIDWQEIADLFGERERYMLKTAENVLDCFYKIWTIRESFVKELGFGLPFYEQETPDIRYAEQCVWHHGQKHCFRSIVLPDHILTVCTSMPFQLQCI